MIFYKTSSFGNDFIEIDLDDLAYPKGRRPLGGPVCPQGHHPLGGPVCLQGHHPLGGLVRAICDRQRGVGADGVVFYRIANKKFNFEIFNRDGGAAELSGNGMAGLAAVLFQRRLGRSPLLLHAAIGRRRVELLERRGRRFVLDVEIGVPDFADRGFFPFLNGKCDVYRVDDVEFHPVSVGNPHAVVICRDPLEDAQLAALGEKIEGHAMFPKRVNVEFVRLGTPGGEGSLPKETAAIRHTSCRVFFYERGVGPTLASSTGSAAVFAVLRRLGLAGDSLAVESGAGDPIPVGGKEGITVRNVTHLVCRGEFFL